MIRYRVLVTTDYHGEVFEARCEAAQIAAVLASAAAAVDSIGGEALREIRLSFQVEVYGQ